ncbi:Hypothetical predicted protein [Podarcis lilfordi]|uniref:Uncharacterized protein n=1 Tax=Podarcis lilfordi TaxID=74358 RepID=A0AA35KZT2_9SAUR|nr:Hypothetical predicted protein [Podarcis lilfordi]
MGNVCCNCEEESCSTLKISRLCFANFLLTLTICREPKQMASRKVTCILFFVFVEPLPNVNTGSPEVYCLLCFTAKPAPAKNESSKEQRGEQLEWRFMFIITTTIIKN